MSGLLRMLAPGLVKALGLTTRTIPEFQTFGRRGEFSVEIADTVRNPRAIRWRFGHDGAYLGLFKRRGEAFEAAAKIARERGDSAEDCGKLIAGVRW